MFSLSGRYYQLLIVVTHVNNNSVQMIIRRLIITLILVSTSDAGFFSDLVSNLKGNSNSGSNSGSGEGVSHGHSNKFNVAPVSEDKAKVNYTLIIFKLTSNKIVSNIESIFYPSSKMKVFDRGRHIL